ncbi:MULTISPECIES: hypothetical protein [Fusobacterium]|uniref:hypothetical protein n=1 Tax=Fusobacterium TaxID=848 RepID=UPI0001BC4C05|nr:MULTISPECIES: hypothetical protein [Fusobacterium]KYM48153.1 hypothetical protein A2U04_05350 [Fusobacterium necrophorum subsp. funduliforme]
MIKIILEKNALNVQGHGNSYICHAVSAVSQYLCSNLEIISYKSGYGYLCATFRDSSISRILLDNFVRFLKDLHSQEIHLEERR